MSITNEILETKYFSSFEHLKNEIDNRCQQSNIPEELSLTPRAIMYLCWYGIPKERMIELLKIQFDGKSIRTVFGNQQWNLSPDCARFFEQYITAPVYMGMKDVSRYLLRTKSSLKMTVTTANGSITQFNLRFFDKVGFSTTTIYESGVFSRAWEKQKAGIALPVYRKNNRLSEEGFALYESLFEREFVGVTAITNYVKRYKAYVNYFYKENPPCE